MKILHVVASYLPARRYGGTITSVHGLCRALAARGHDVHVYTTSVDGPGDSPVPHGVPVAIDGVQVWYFESRHFRRVYRAPALGQALRNHVHEFAVVHTHAIYLWPLWTAASEARRASVPYVISPRGMLEKALVEQKSPLLKAALIGFIERRNIEGAAAIHVTSRREADEAIPFGFDARQIVEIPNGVDLEVDAGGAVSPEIDRIATGAPFVLFLGRINWKKGLDRLISALPHAPGVRVVLAGNDEDGYQRVLEASAERFGVRAQVMFAGPVLGADKAAIIRSARALVLPSYSENFGNVVLEAMAAARPVIVTGEVGLSDVVRDSGAGIVSDGSPEDLGAALVTLTTDVRGATAMGERGREAARRFSWDEVASRMERLYESVQLKTAC